MHGKLEYCSEPLLEAQKAPVRRNSRKNSITLTISPESQPNKIIFPFDVEEGTFLLDNFAPQKLNKRTEEKDILKFFSVLYQTCNNFESLKPIYQKFKVTQKLYFAYLLLIFVAGLAFLVFKGMQVQADFPFGIIMLCLFIAFIIFSIVYFFVDKSFKDELAEFRKKIKILIRNNTCRLTAELGVEWKLPENHSDYISWLELYIHTEDPVLTKKYSGEYDGGENSTFNGSQLNSQYNDRCDLEAIPETENAFEQIMDGRARVTTT